MFKPVEKTELNQISLTGLRALVFIGLLITKPRSLNEIRKAFIDLHIIDETHSNDILRIDLNTIKSMGCEILRCSQKTGYKYVLQKHPFTLNIPKEEIVVLKRVYNFIKRYNNLSLLMEYDRLFKKIAFHICDNKSKEALLGISVLKYYDTEMIEELIHDCNLKRTLVLSYQKANCDNISDKKIVAQELVYKNDKLYLYGYDLNIKKSTVLNLRRIKSIKQRLFGKYNIEDTRVKIKFVLKNIDLEKLEINETIIEKLDDGYIIEGFYHNNFLAMQRILSFGKKCIVLEPQEFKDDIIKKIKEMRNIYEC